uniref:Peptidase family M48 n=1 Tax=Candidatus Kentrum sp. TC TaxID=2126339 RepID=A0A450YBQ2_9GAMM|nr:MAG: Peptidase family M48 [Candidatus Kentron sp. TC]VFK54608.1 MAG: Peptidase family M48 [Candidatus Kentron sp. TC]
MQVRKKLVALALMLFCGACSAERAIAGRSGMDCSSEPERAERAMRRIREEWPLRGEDEVIAYLRNVGNRTARRAGIEYRANWRFHLVRDRSYNAFSLGAGRILLTEGAILNSTTEEELIAVLAHEFGHHLAGHFCRPRPARSAGWVDELFSWSFNDDDRRQGPVRSRPGMGSLRQGEDPRKEREADRMAIEILSRLGIDPKIRFAVMRHVRSRVAEGGHYSAWRDVVGMADRSASIHLSPPAKNSASFLRIRALLRAEWQ